MIDVIIPVYKPDKTFRLLLQRLIHQTEVIHQIIIINTEKQFWNEDLIKGVNNCKVFHIKKEEFDHGNTRRFGVEQSKADFMVFMTDDAIPKNKRMLHELIKPFIDNRVSVSYARQIPAENCGIIEKYTRQYNYPEQSKIRTEKDIKKLGIKAFFCSNVCAAYRRSDYDALGGFASKTIFNEDMIFARAVLKSGKAIAYTAKAEVIHSHNFNNKQLFQRNFDLGVSQKQYKQVFQTVSSEGEGINLVIEISKKLIGEGKFYLIPKLVQNSLSKYMGYQIGKHYDKLPPTIVTFCSLNKEYWKKR